MEHVKQPGLVNWSSKAPNPAVANKGSVRYIRMLDLIEERIVHSRHRGLTEPSVVIWVL